MQRVATAAYVRASNHLREVRDATRDAARERGLTTTEIAVMTFILVSIASVIGVLIYNYARETVVEDLNDRDIDRIPDETATN